jgi:hypothetical protein
MRAAPIGTEATRFSTIPRCAAIEAAEPPAEEHAGTLALKIAAIAVPSADLDTPSP